MMRYRVYDKATGKLKYKSKGRPRLLANETFRPKVQYKEDKLVANIQVPIIKDEEITVRREHKSIGDAVSLLSGIQDLYSRGIKVYLQVHENSYPLFKHHPAVYKLQHLEDETETSTVVNLSRPCPAGNYESNNKNIEFSRNKIFALAMGAKEVVRPKLYLVQDELSSVEVEDNAIGLVIKSTEKFKNYPYMQELADELNKRGKAVYAYDKELELDGCINITGENIRAVAVYLSKMEYVIGPDTGPMHICDALGIRYIGLFGATISKLHEEKYPNSLEFIQGYCLSRDAPCMYNFCQSTSPLPCMNIDPQRVIWLANKPNKMPDKAKRGVIYKSTQQEVGLKRPNQTQQEMRPDVLQVADKLQVDRAQLGTQSTYDKLSKILGDKIKRGVIYKPAQQQVKFKQLDQTQQQVGSNILQVVDKPRTDKARLRIQPIYNRFNKNTDKSKPIEQRIIPKRSNQKRQQEHPDIFQIVDRSQLETQSIYNKPNKILGDKIINKFDASIGLIMFTPDPNNIGGAEYSFLQLFNYLKQQHDVELLYVAHTKVRDDNEFIKYTCSLRDLVNKSYKYLITRITSVRNISYLPHYEKMITYCQDWVQVALEREIQNVKHKTAVVNKSAQRTLAKHSISSIITYNPAFNIGTADKQTKHNPPVLGYFGRLGPKKKAERLIVAAKETGYPLLIAGDGAEKNNLRQYNYGTFLGWLESREDKEYFFNNVDIICLPSEFESAPLSVIESLYQKTPVISTAIGNIPDLIRAVPQIPIYMLNYYRPFEIDPKQMDWEAPVSEWLTDDIITGIRMLLDKKIEWETILDKLQDLVDVENIASTLLNKLKE